MAIAIFLDTVIIRRAALESRLPGGLAAYRETEWGRFGFPRADEHLVAFSAMAPDVADTFAKLMAPHGIVYVGDEGCFDIALVRDCDLGDWFPNQRGEWRDGIPESSATPIEPLRVEWYQIPCGWLSYGTWGGLFVCWLRGTEPGEVALVREEGWWPDGA